VKRGTFKENIRLLAGIGFGRIQFLKKEHGHLHQRVTATIGKRGIQKRETAFLKRNFTSLLLVG